MIINLHLFHNSSLLSLLGVRNFFNELFIEKVILFFFYDDSVYGLDKRLP